ncbi:MAG: trypsin-like peptidase domain-containing protein [Chloroflexota bacterium]
MTDWGNYPVGVGTPEGYAAPYEAVATGVPWVRAVGDPPMPLNDQYPKSVVFVVGLRRDPASGAFVQTAIGTAFFVAIPTALPDRVWVYLVTAAHVVEAETETWVRVRAKNGLLPLVRVPQWTIHPKDDVAVTLVGGVANDLDMICVQEAIFLDVWPRKPTVGDRVYFIGLLAMAESMVQENVPMVRSGTLGRMYQERVPLRHGDDRVTYHQAHLIDCRSYGGFSGSPCFVQFQSTLGEGERRGGVFVGGVSLVPETVCLGLISGHWDDMVRAKATGEMANDEIAQNIRFPINTGVGIVTPIEKVRECLMDENLKAARDADDAQLVETAAREEREKAGTPDTTDEPPAGLTKSDFEAALRKVSRRKPSDEGAKEGS